MACFASIPVSHSIMLYNPTYGESRQRYVTEMNTWLQAQCAARGYGFWDYYTWNLANYTNTTYYNVDQTHPIQAGYNYLCPNMVAAMGAYI